MMLALRAVPAAWTLAATSALPEVVVPNAVETAGCSADTFKSSLNSTLCPDLTPRPGIASADACRELCCGIAFGQCGVWQWCNNPDGGCGEWASVRCHTGPTNAAECQPSGHWIGQSRRQPPPQPPQAVRRQGFSGFLGPDFSCDDSNALGLKDSWYYTWMMSPSQQNRCPPVQAPRTLGKEFVPMVNGIGQLGANFNEHLVEVWQDTNAHFLLGYNEPDPGNNHPHIADPAAAAHDWVEVQALAERLSLKLISPVTVHAYD